MQVKKACGRIRFNILFDKLSMKGHVKQLKISDTYIKTCII